MLTSSNGILQQVWRAKEQTESANDTEKISMLINEYQIYSNQKTFNDFFNEKKEALEIQDNRIISDDINLITIGNKQYLANKNGNIAIYKNSLQESVDKGLIELGQEVNYDIQNGKNNYTKENESGYYFTIKKEKTGYTEDQEFNVSDYTGKWRILYDGSEGYGVQIISTSNILGEKKLALNWGDGYNNEIEIVNNVAGHFINTKYVLSARALFSRPNDNENTIGPIEYFDTELIHNVLLKKSYTQYYTFDYSRMTQLKRENLLEYNVNIWGMRTANNTSSEFSFGASCWQWNADYNTVVLGYIRHSDGFLNKANQKLGCVSILHLDPSVQIELVTQNGNTIINFK